MGRQFFCSLEKKNFCKGKEFFLTEAHFISKGTLEVFIMDYKSTGEYIKVGNLNSDGCFVGFYNYFDGDPLDVFYRVKTDAVLVKISNKRLEELFGNNTNFLKIAMDTFFYRMMRGYSSFLFRTTSSKKDIVKNILELESENLEGMELESIVDLVDSYKINRSTFYKSINSLEEGGVIERRKKKIKFVKERAKE